MGIFIFSLFFISVSAVSYTKNSMDKKGFFDGSYMDKLSFLTNTQDMLFNENYKSTPNIYPAVNPSNQSAQPVWTDLNQDGINYLILNTAGTIRVLQNKTLTPVFTFNPQTCNDVIDLSVFYADKPHLVVTCEYTEKISTSIYEWNGTRFNLDNTYNTTGTYNDGFAMNCDNSFICVSVYRSGLMAPMSYFQLQADVYDNLSTNLTIAGYLPRINNLPVGDVDSDGINEFILLNENLGSGGYVKIARIKYNDAGFISVMNNKTTIVLGTNPGYILSAPLLGAYTDISENTVVFAASTSAGVAFSSGKYRLFAVHFSGGSWQKIAQYPDLYEVSGWVTSNTFEAAINPYSNKNDFCVISYQLDTVENATILTCANGHNLPFLTSSVEMYTLENYTGMFNTVPWLSEPHTQYGLTYSVNAENDGRSTILTRAGIFKANPDARTRVYGFGELERVYNNPIDDATLFPISLKNSPYYDLLAQSTTSIFYIDDLTSPDTVALTFTKVGNYPCFNQQWKINTTVGISFKINSYLDLYQVRYRGFLYYGTADEQLINWSAFITSGTVNFLGFKANSTTLSPQILRVEFEDDSGHSGIYSTTFNVGYTGVDETCQETGAGVEVIDQTKNQTSPYYNPNTIQDNYVKRQIYAQSSALGIPIILFFLIVMVGVNIVVFISGMSSPQLREHLGAFLIFLILIDFFSIIIATFLGIISPAFIISLIALILIAAAFMLAKHFNKSAAG